MFSVTFNFTLYLFLLPGLHLDNHFCNPFNLFSFILTSFFNFSPCDVTIKFLMTRSNPRSMLFLMNTL